MPTFAAVLTLLAIATFSAGIAPLVLRRRKNKLRFFIAFAAGVLLGTAFFDLIPESFSGNELAPIALAVGFLVAFFTEAFGVLHPCEDGSCRVHDKFGALAFAGLFVHALFDGIILVAAAGTAIFAPVAFAIAAHKLPAATALGSIFIAENFSKQKVMTLLALFALATPLGAWLALTGGKLAESKEQAIIAFTAGIFIYLGASDFLPVLHRDRSNRKNLAILIFVAGMIAAAATAV